MAIIEVPPGFDIVAFIHEILAYAQMVIPLAVISAIGTFLIKKIKSMGKSAI